MLNALQQTALAKVGQSHDLGNDTSHDVDFYVHVRGSLKQGSGYKQTFPAAADLVSLLAVALSKLNRNTAEFVASLVAEAEQMDQDALGKEVDNIKGYADAAIQAIKQSTTKTCKGKLTAKVSASIVDPRSIDLNMNRELQLVEAA